MDDITVNINEKYEYRVIDSAEEIERLINQMLVRVENFDNSYIDEKRESAK